MLTNTCKVRNLLTEARDHEKVLKSTNNPDPDNVEIVGRQVKILQILLDICAKGHPL